MSAKTLVDMLRAAGHDERLSTGALYLEAADEIERWERCWNEQAKHVMEQHAIILRYHAALLAAKREHTLRCKQLIEPAPWICTCGAAAHNAAIDEALGNG